MLWYNNIMNKNKFLKVNEVAEIARVHPETVRRWLLSGKLQGVKMGRNWLINILEIPSYLRKEYEDKTA